jgi:hypothetical protein
MLHNGGRLLQMLQIGGLAQAMPTNGARQAKRLQNHGTNSLQPMTANFFWAVKNKSAGDWVFVLGLFN